MTQEFEQRLRRVEDQLAIADLRARYCHLLDESRWQEFAELFTEDGTFEGVAKASSRAGIYQFFSEDVPLIAEKFWHFCTNGTVELAGDRATGRISMEYISVTNGASYVSAGHYDDVLVCVEGKWKFKSRKITFYFYSPLKDGFTGLPPSEKQRPPAIALQS